MRLYLAGPMRGYPQFNHPAFDAATIRLRAAGHEVFSPAEHDRHSGMNVTGMQGTDEEMDTVGGLRALMKADLTWICDNADGVALLPGWEASTGACAERALAVCLGIPARPWKEFT